ncbi:hypothetical protein ABVT39_022312 [Epinephelus coioides]
MDWPVAFVTSHLPSAPPDQLQAFGVLLVPPILSECTTPVTLTLVNEQDAHGAFQLRDWVILCQTPATLSALLCLALLCMDLHCMVFYWRLLCCVALQLFLHATLAWFMLPFLQLSFSSTYLVRWRHRLRGALQRRSDYTHITNDLWNRPPTRLLIRRVDGEHRSPCGTRGRDNGSMELSSCV